MSWGYYTICPGVYNQVQVLMFAFRRFCNKFYNHILKGMRIWSVRGLLYFVQGLLYFVQGGGGELIRFQGLKMLSRGKFRCPKGRLTKSRGIKVVVREGWKAIVRRVEKLLSGGLKSYCPVVEIEKVPGGKNPKKTYRHHPCTDFFWKSPFLNLVSSRSPPY